MRSHLRYLGYVIRHKWYVFQAGRILGVGLWQLLVHDLSKFSRAEWGPYRRRFFVGRVGKLDHGADPDEFHRAFMHHWHVNPHHWEHWLRVWVYQPKPGDLIRQELVALEMPRKYAREMVADWAGAGRAITGARNPSPWYYANRKLIVLAPHTRTFVERELRVIARHFGE